MRPTYNRIQPLRFLSLLLAALGGCQSVNRVARTLETVVLTESVTYEVIAPVPPLLRVENTGSSSIEVWVREVPLGANLSSYHLSPDGSMKERVGLQAFYVVLTGTESPSFAHLSVSVDAAQEGGAGDFPGLTLHDPDGR